MYNSPSLRSSFRWESAKAPGSCSYTAVVCGWLIIWLAKVFTLILLLYTRGRGDDGCFLSLLLETYQRTVKYINVRAHYLLGKADCIVGLLKRICKWTTSWINDLISDLHYVHNVKITLLNSNPELHNPILPQKGEFTVFYSIANLK